MAIKNYERYTSSSLDQDVITMKFYAFALLLLAPIAFSAPIDSCQTNGYSQQKIHERIESIAEAMQDNDAELFSEQVSLPFTVNLKSGKHVFISITQVENDFEKIFSTADRQRLAKQLSQPKQPLICRSEGVGLLNGGIWLAPNDLGIMSINASIIPHTQLLADKPYGQAIAPITSQQELATFAKAYNALLQQKMVRGSKLSVIKNNTAGYQLNADDNSGNITLYNADINNSGVRSYVLCYDNQGSLRTDRIRFIGVPSQSHLIPITIYPLINRTFHIDGSRWYLFHNTPFLTFKGLTYLNFRNRGVVCTYLWKGHSIRLVSKADQQCIVRNKHS